MSELLNSDLIEKLFRESELRAKNNYLKQIQEERTNEQDRELEAYFREAEDFAVEAEAHAKERRKYIKKNPTLLSTEVDDPSVIDFSRLDDAWKYCNEQEEKRKEQEKIENSGTIGLHGSGFVVGGGPISPTGYNDFRYATPYPSGDEEIYCPASSFSETNDEKKETNDSLHPVIRTFPGWVVVTEQGSYLLSEIYSDFEYHRLVSAYRPVTKTTLTETVHSELNIPNSSGTHTYKSFLGWKCCEFSARRVLNTYDPLTANAFNEQELRGVLRDARTWPLGTLLQSKKYNIELPATVCYVNQFGFTLKLDSPVDEEGDSQGEKKINIKEGTWNRVGSFVFYSHSEQPHFTTYTPQLEENGWVLNRSEEVYFKMPTAPAKYNASLPKPVAKSKQHTPKEVPKGKDKFSVQHWKEKDRTTTTSTKTPSLHRSQSSKQRRLSSSKREKMKEEEERALADSQEADTLGF